MSILSPKENNRNVAMKEYQFNNSLMEEYVNYLKCRLLSNYMIRLYVSYIRRLHNHVGKPYVVINEADIQEYMSYLKDFQSLQFYTLSKHLSAIKHFYKYLQSKGEVIKDPCEGIRIKRY